MSTVDAGQRIEQQPEPTDAAGGKSEVDRNVQGTALRAGFAELIALAESNAIEADEQAFEWEEWDLEEEACYFQKMAKAFRVIATRLRAMSGCEG